MASVPATEASARPVVYRREDYIGFWRRLVIFAVDLLTLCVLVPLVAFLTTAGLSVVAGQESAAAGIGAFLVTVATVWVYLAVLKPSRFRTPGYWVAGAKIVTLRGTRPSPLRMTLRLVWSLAWLTAWPINFFLIDLLWTTIDDERQMLRDLFTGVRLVRNRATPAGDGVVRYSRYSAFGLAFVYAQVRAEPAVEAEVID